MRAIRSVRPARASRLLALGAVAGLTLAGCGGQSLQEQGDAAKANLMKASSIEITVRLDDPDGDLRDAAMAEGDLTESQAEALVGGSYSTKVVRADGTPLSEASLAEGAGIAESVAAYQYSVTVRSGQGDLGELRVVDSTAYLALGADEIDRLLAEAGEDDLSSLSTDAPPELAPVLDALTGGEWLALPLEDYLTQVDGLLAATGIDPFAESGGDAAALSELLSSIEPHVSIKDLGSSGDERDVEVSVKLKSVLEVVLNQAGLFGADAGTADMLGSELDDAVTDDPVRATLTLKGDHVDALRLPLANVVPAIGEGAITAAERQEFLDAVGTAALVIEVDDTAGEVEKPADVSDVDVKALLDTFLAPFLGGMDGEFSALPDEELYAEYEACLAEGTDPDVCDEALFGSEEGAPEAVPGLDPTTDPGLDAELEQLYAEYEACLAEGTDPDVCDAEVFGSEVPTS